MRQERVKITRDTNTVHNRAVSQWEIPLLEELFGEGNVEPLGLFDKVAGEYPDAKVELDRLVRAYGSDPQSGVAHANSVYGNGRTGIKMLQKLIDDAQSEEKADARKAVPAPARKRKSAPMADALLG